jgi:seryl-tRNA synthetase
MLDIKFIREYPDHVREGIRKKGDVDRVDEVLGLDVRRRELLQKGEALKAKRNEVSDEIGRLKRTGGDAAKAIAEMEQVKQQIKAIDDELRTVEEQFHSVMLQIPNVPNPSVPEGKTPADNEVIATWGAPPVIDFKPKTHWELNEKLDLIDFERGVKITGAGFPVYKGQGARLQRALINFFLDEATAKGYKEIQAPLMVNATSATGAGQLLTRRTSLHRPEG